MKTPGNTSPQQGHSITESEQPGSFAATPGGAVVPELFSLIKQQPFFAGLDLHQLQLLADSAMRMHFDAGQLILEEGGQANRFYLILEGKVALESEAKDGGSIPIETLGPGDDLGWSWLFPPYYIHLSARALEPTDAIFFYGTRLREQCEEDHDLGFELMKRIAGVVTHRLKAAQSRLAEYIVPVKISDAGAAAGGVPGQEGGCSQPGNT